MSEATVVIRFDNAELMILLESLSSFQIGMNESTFKTEVRDLRKKIVAVMTGQAL